MFTRIVTLIKRAWFKQLTGASLVPFTFSNPRIAAADQQRLWHQRFALWAARLRRQATQRAAAHAAVRRAAWLAGPQPGGTVVFASIVLLLCAGSYIYAAQSPGPPETVDTPHRQYADTDKRTHKSSTHIAYTDLKFTITFSGCEENEKQHWSCKYTSPDGEEHWMYMPGLKVTNATATKGGG